MKKIFAIMVSAILILCILSGCGSPNVSNPSNENTLHVANSVAEHSMETLINHADIIVAGKVSDSSKYVMSADSTYKTSTVSIDVSDVYKGGILTGDSVTVEINTYLGVNGVIAEHEPLPPTFSICASLSKLKLISSSMIGNLNLMDLSHWPLGFRSS